MQRRYLFAVFWPIMASSPSWAAELSPDAIHTIVSSGECPSPLQRIDNPNLRAMCGSYDDTPPLKYNLCLNKFQALDADVYKFNSIVDGCIKKSGKTATANQTIGQPATAPSGAGKEAKAASTTDLSVFKKRLETGKCEPGLSQVEPPTLEGRFCPAPEDEPARAISCANAAKEDSDAVSRYNDWVDQCQSAAGASTDVLKERLTKAKQHIDPGKDFANESESALQLSQDLLENERAAAAKAKADAQAKKQAQKARKQRQQQTPQQTQTYQPPPPPAGPSCRNYHWYVECLGESPASYCIQTIHNDVPNCIP